MQLRCTSLRSVGFRSDGKTIAWTPRLVSPEYATFCLPCGKCIECRLEYARQWAVRCVHEASMHDSNSFITLTYSDKDLKSPRLIYPDFQKFMKKLRKTQNEPIGCFVTGEYGEKTKRPHWHAILFNYTPRDGVPSRKTIQGDQTFTSESLEKIWGHGRTEYGSVTFRSAGYCARYSAKKLIHPDEFNKEFEPISKKSSKHAIGKTFLEKHYKDIFNYGECILSDGNSCSIPRYYEKWFKEKYPLEWRRYVTEVKIPKALHSQNNTKKETAEQNRVDQLRHALGKASGPLRREIRREIAKERLRILNSYQKET